MIHSFTKITIFSMSLLTGTIFGCSAADKIDNVTDCDAICKRYADCRDNNYGIADCAKKCRDKSAQDQDYMRKVNTCDACIKNADCKTASFSCVTECVGIVP